MSISSSNSRSSGLVTLKLEPPACLQILAGLTTLTHLDVSDIPCVMDKTVQVLAKLPALECLLLTRYPTHHNLVLVFVPVAASLLQPVDALLQFREPFRSVV